MVPRQLSKLEKIVGPMGLTPAQKLLYSECKKYISGAKEMAKSGNYRTMELIAWVEDHMPVDLTQKLDKIEATYRKYKNT